MAIMLYLSPRLGFSWNYGTASQVGAFAGAFRGPRATLRGGIGVFQNTPQATLLGAAIDNTGLATGLQQITCVGPATPVPDWSAYAANPGTIPTSCADGTTGSVFANAAPNVTLFSKGWQAPRLTGQVTGVSADLKIDPATQASYYEARILIPEIETAKLREATTTPGMPVQAFIYSGARRTLFEQIGEPILESWFRGMRQS